MPELEPAVPELEPVVPELEPVVPELEPAAPELDVPLELPDDPVLASEFEFAPASELPHAARTSRHDGAMIAEPTRATDDGILMICLSVRTVAKAKEPKHLVRCCTRLDGAHGMPHLSGSCRSRGFFHRSRQGPPGRRERGATCRERKAISTNWKNVLSTGQGVKWPGHRIRPSSLQDDAIRRPTGRTTMQRSWHAQVRKATQRSL
jgi:hypothetical protein